MRAYAFPKIVEFLKKEGFEVTIVSRAKWVPGGNAAGVIHCSKDGDGYTITYWVYGALNVEYDGDKTADSVNHPKSLKLYSEIKRYVRNPKKRF